MARSKITTAFAAVVAAGALIGGGAAVALSQSDTSAATTTSVTPSGLGSTTDKSTANQGTAANQGSTTTQPGADAQGRGGPMGGHEHTAVTGDELAKVTAAVTAKFSGATVSEVAKDPDGSYDVHATKDGSRVVYEVSADLATIEERTGGPGMGGPGSPGADGQAPTGSLNPSDANGTADAATPAN